MKLDKWTKHCIPLSPRNVTSESVRSTETTQNGIAAKVYHALLLN